MSIERPCRQCAGALPAAGHVAAQRAQPVRHGAGRHRARQPRQPRSPVRRFRIRRRGPGSRHPRRPASPRGPGEARDLPVHGRWAVADRDVRLQARARRSATASSCRIPCGRGSGSPGCPGTSRRCRSRARSSDSAGTAAMARGCPTCCRRRPRSSTTCASSAPCSRMRSITTPRLRSSRPARRSPAAPAWDRGFITGSAATTTTFRRSSSSSRPAKSISLCIPGCGAAGFFRPATRACSSGAARTPCCT